MTLKTKVEAAAKKAFTKIDSLCVDAVFTKKVLTGFNLATNEIVTTPDLTITKRVFIEEKIVRSESGPSMRITAYFLPDGNDYSVYDTVVAGGKKYKPVVSTDSTYLVVMELTYV